MSESLVPFRLQTSFSVSTAEDHSFQISQGLDHVLNDVRQIRKNVDHLERTKALYTIHLRNCQSNYDTLKSLYNQLKFQFDYPTPPPSIEPKDLLNQYKSNQELNQPSSIPDNQKVVNPQTQSRNFSSFIQPNNITQGIYNQDLQAKPEIKIVDVPWKFLDPSTNQPLLTSPFPITNILTLNISSIISTIQYNSTGSNFCFADGHFVYLIQSRTGIIEKVMELPRISGKNELNTKAIAFNPDSTLLAISNFSKDLCIFSTQTGNLLKTFESHKQAVTSLVFLPSNGHLLSVGYDGLLCVWDMSNMTLINKISHDQHQFDDQELIQASKENAIVYVAVGFNDSFVAIGFVKGTVGIYDSNFSQSMSEFQAHSGLLLSLTTSKTESLILTTSEDRTCKLWSLRGVASLIHTFSGHKDYVITSCFSNDNKIIFTGSKDKTIRAWSRDTGNCLFCIMAHNNTIFRIDHDPQREQFVSCSGDGLICEWTYNRT